MAIHQLSVFVENRPGKVLELVRLLADAKINIRAMSIADTQDFGILRLIVSDVHKALEIVSSDSLATVTDVIAVDMNDEAGALYHILDILGKEKVNIEYMYAFTAPSKKGAYVVLRVDDNDAAEAVLRKNGIDYLTQPEIETL